MKLSDEIREAIKHVYVIEAYEKHIEMLEACDEPQMVVEQEMQVLSERVNYLESELAEHKRAERTGW